MEIKADALLGPRERLLIQRAISRLEYQTNGMANVTIVYTPTVEDMNLLRIESWYSQVGVLDKRFNGSVYGFTYLTGRMFLVDDRLKDDDVFIHVAMHEILHHMGCDHLDSPTSVMYLVTNAEQHVTCMDRADAGEFCRVVGCDAERLNYCGR